MTSPPACYAQKNYCIQNGFIKVIEKQPKEFLWSHFGEKFLIVVICENILRLGMHN